MSRHLRHALIVAFVTLFGSASDLSFANTSQIKEDVAKANTAYDKALATNDVATLEHLVADECVLIDFEGTVLKKRDLISQIRSGELHYDDSHSDNVEVRIYDGVAIINGRWTGKGIYKGKPFDQTLMYTTVYSNNGGQGRVISDHSSEIKKMNVT